MSSFFRLVMSLTVSMYDWWEKMRRFTQIVFPPWVRTYPKSTSAEFFVPARTLIAIKLLNKEMDGLKQVCRIVQHRGQYQFLEVDFISATYEGPGTKQSWWVQINWWETWRRDPEAVVEAKLFFCFHAGKFSSAAPSTRQMVTSSGSEWSPGRVPSGNASYRRIRV
jgi:hypothetical protein